LCPDSNSRLLESQAIPAAVAKDATLLFRLKPYCSTSASRFVAKICAKWNLAHILHVRAERVPSLFCVQTAVLRNRLSYAKILMLRWLEAFVRKPCHPLL